MIGLLCFVVAVLASPFKSKIRLEAENATLRHQMVVLRRKLKGGTRLTNNDRWFFVQLYRWFPSILPVLMIIRPETLVRWHRAGFRRYWRWKSRRLGGRLMHMKASRLPPARCSAQPGSAAAFTSCATLSPMPARTGAASSPPLSQPLSPRTLRQPPENNGAMSPISCAAVCRSCSLAR
jgi:hypothetical protein